MCSARIKITWTQHTFSIGPLPFSYKFYVPNLDRCILLRWPYIRFDSINRPTKGIPHKEHPPWANSRGARKGSLNLQTQERRVYWACGDSIWTKTERKCRHPKNARRAVQNWCGAGVAQLSRVPHTSPGQGHTMACTGTRRSSTPSSL